MTTIATSSDCDDPDNTLRLVRLYYPSAFLDGSSIRYTCLCQQKGNPSAHVVLSKKIYHCFGCGKGGSLIDFVMQQEDCSLAEAIKKLAEFYGIDHGNE